MTAEIVDLPEISVIGKQGLCTKERNIVAELWKRTNAGFAEIAALGMKNADGTYVGFWGAMSDETMSFKPWTDGFSRGLYLAGVETGNTAVAPPGWSKWTMPARMYLAVDVAIETYSETFSKTLAETIPGMKLELTGAVCDFTDPATGGNKLFFPVRRRG